jgi:hypothetical protein
MFGLFITFAGLPTSLQEIKYLDIKLQKERAARKHGFRQ